MKAQLTQLIIAQDHYQILNWAKALSDKDRYASMEILKTLKPEEIMNEPRPKEYKAAYYQKYQLLDSIKNYMLICCIRSKKDLSQTIPHDAWDKNNSVLHAYLRKPGFGFEPLIAYFELFPPDYLDAIVERNSKPRQWNNNFHLLWKLYEHGWLTFDEEIFVRSLFIIPMFDRNTMEDVLYLSQNPKAINQVLMQFYKHEIPILDISKWHEKAGSCCKKCTEYWDEVFSELLSQGMLNDRSIIRNLLGTLTHNWKKGHLDWHIRLLKQFNTTSKEYLNNQDYLLAALSANSNSVCNFVINTVETIYKEKTFDTESFLQNLPNLFAKEKSDNAILKALDIVSYLLENKPDLRKYTDTISNALMQPNNQIQEKAARLLKQYLNEQELKTITEPFAASLKQKARDILQIQPQKTEEHTISPLENYPLIYPTTWEDFIFHIGKAINTLDAADIDIMYNGFIQLQDQFPEKYLTQLKPFIKKAEKAFAEKELLVYIAEFFENWQLAGSTYKVKKPTDNYNPNPFMRNRNKWVLNKLKRNCRLSLLSTPTHYPFYIHPAILVTRLCEYEKADEQVEIEDLIIACNRILKTGISTEVKDQVKKLKGYYAGAIQYLLGISGTISFDKNTLPLWTQIARTKEANNIFKEFEQSEAKDYPTVVNPFSISYKITRDFSSCGKYHWDRIILEGNWNHSYAEAQIKRAYPYPYFYTAYNSHKAFSKAGFLYWLSLIPHYCAPVLLADLPDTASGNEVSEFEYCSYPLQYLVENQIQIHHSGWLYIATCLIFEKKISRTLAAEYISIAFGLGFINQEYLSECIATMIMDKFAPVNRLIEYFDQIHPDHIKTFQLQIIEKCMLKADKKNLPTNFKKLVAAGNEIRNSLNQ